MIVPLPKHCQYLDPFQSFARLCNATASTAQLHKTKGLKIMLTILTQKFKHFLVRIFDEYPENLSVRAYSVLVMPNAKCYIESMPP